MSQSSRLATGSPLTILVSPTKSTQIEQYYLNMYGKSEKKLLNLLS